MNSRNRTSTGKFSVRSTKLPISSSFTPRRTTQLILTLNGESSVSIVYNASITLPWNFLSRRTSNGNFAATNVSRLTLTLFNPAARISGRNFAKRTPFVVMPRESGSSRLRLISPRSWTMRAKSPRMVGSPPVKRTLRTPQPTNKRIKRDNSVAVRMSPVGLGSAASSPSSGAQYWQRKLHRSVSDTRRYRCCLRNLSTKQGSTLGLAWATTFLSFTGKSSVG
mmetsp:Transcript_62091/g.178644  ORF Transcript_62091/g.178644 Transcript_62091/m.178644 type:complete len:223 (+) Transcript_62091:513-1181(+)